jgi:hypothetical protein
MLTKPTLSIVVEYEDPTGYYAIPRSDRSEIAASIVRALSAYFPQSLLDSWAALDPVRTRVGAVVFDAADESMSIDNVRAFVDEQLLSAGDAQNSFRSLQSPQYAPTRACTWIDLLHRDGFAFYLERNGSGLPYELTGRSTAGASAKAFIRVKFDFEEPAKTSG